MLDIGGKNQVIPGGSILLKLLHTEDTANDTGVDTEDEATKAGRTRESISPPSVDLGGVLFHRIVLDDLL